MCVCFQVLGSGSIRRKQWDGLRSKHHLLHFLCLHYFDWWRLPELLPGQNTHTHTHLPPSYSHPSETTGDRTRIRSCVSLCSCQLTNMIKKNRLGIEPRTLCSLCPRQLLLRPVVILLPPVDSVAFNIVVYFLCAGDRLCFPISEDAADPGSPGEVSIHQTFILFLKWMYCVS